MVNIVRRNHSRAYRQSQLGQERAQAGFGFGGKSAHRTFKSAKRKFTMQERMALVDELPEDDELL